MKAEDGTGPVNADELEDDDLDRLPLGAEEGPDGGTVLVPGGSPLPTLRVLPQGISRKRLEQASATCSCRSSSPATSTRRTSS